MSNFCAEHEDFTSSEEDFYNIWQPVKASSFAALSEPRGNN